MTKMLLIALITLLSSCLSALSVHSGAVEDKYSCPHGWSRYGSKKCLKYINELQDYERAQTTCRSKNQGTLVSIHSHEEQNFVYSYIHSIASSSTPVWLGAKQIDFESILWLDKTENTYTNWAPSEPSHPDEICIAINPRNGMWHDVMCTEANVPACERAPTTQWPFFVAFCSEGWFQFNDEKCVRIISSQALNFYESQELCRSKYNSKLLSIKTDKESEFLHNLIKFRDVKLPVWLGAVQNDFSSFNWIDKTDVTFTNWAEGEPNDPDHACLSMTASGGKWADNDCKEQKLILCQKVPEDSSCETGWLQFRQDKCYRFVHIRLAFDDAESLCNNLYGGHLPSIHSQEEQFMLSQFLASVNVKNGSEIWLGGRQMDFHNFNWGDGSLFNYSYWEHGEPNFPAEKCIEMSWRNGRWNDINCRLKRAVLCERQVTSRHHIKPNLYQPVTCLDSNCTSAGNGDKGSSMSQLDLDKPDQPDPPLPTSLNITSSIPAAELAGNVSLTPPANLGLTNRTTTEETLILPPDDKPIKVITSIIHRDQQPTPEPLVVAAVAISHQQPSPIFNSTSTSTLSTTTTMSEPNANNISANNTTNNAASIHYNLPGRAQVDQTPQQSHPPPSSSGTLAAEAQPEPLAAQTKQKEHSLVNGSGEQTANNPIPVRAPSSSPQVTQQSFDSSNPNSSLLDKLRLESSSSNVQQNTNGNNSTASLPLVAASLPPTVTSTNNNQPTNLTSVSNQQQQQSAIVKEASVSSSPSSTDGIGSTSTVVVPEKSTA